MSGGGGPRPKRPVDFNRQNVSKTALKQATLVVPGRIESDPIQQRLERRFSPICDSEALDIDRNVRHDIQPTLIDKDLPFPILDSTQSSNIHNQVLSAICRIYIISITVDGRYSLMITRISI
jgi:hypothetical protein